MMKKYRSVSDYLINSIRDAITTAAAATATADTATTTTTITSSVDTSIGRPFRSTSTAASTATIGCSNSSIGRMGRSKMVLHRLYQMRP